MPTRTLVAVCFLITLAATFASVLIIADGVTTETATVITPVLGFVSFVIVQLLTGKSVANKVDAVTEQVGHVDKKVERVLNGEMEGKIRKVLIDILDERLDDSEPSA
jgi:hypothetical protein